MATHSYIRRKRKISHMFLWLSITAESKNWLYRQSQCHTSHNFAAFCKVAVHFMRIESGLQIVKYCSSLICKNHGKDQSNLKYRQQMLCMIAPPQTQENFSPTSFSPPTPKKRRAMIQKKAGTINQALI